MQKEKDTLAKKLDHTTTKKRKKRDKKQIKDEKRQMFHNFLGDPANQSNSLSLSLSLSLTEPKLQSL